MVREESFGKRLQRLRLAKGLSAGKLAIYAGVTEGAIRQMEYGQTKSASFAVGVKMAEMLGVDPLYLAEGDYQEPERADLSTKPAPHAGGTESPSSPKMGAWMELVEQQIEENARGIEECKQALHQVQAELGKSPPSKPASRKHGRRKAS